MYILKLIFGAFVNVHMATSLEIYTCMIVKEQDALHALISELSWYGHWQLLNYVTHEYCFPHAEPINRYNI